MEDDSRNKKLLKICNEKIIILEQSVYMNKTKYPVFGYRRDDAKIIGPSYKRNFKTLSAFRHFLLQNEDVNLSKLNKIYKLHIKNNNTIYKEFQGVKNRFHLILQKESKWNNWTNRDIIENVFYSDMFHTKKLDFINMFRCADKYSRAIYMMDFNNLLRELILVLVELKNVNKKALAFI